MLGVVGGAIAGHKIQDGVSDWKDKRDEKKEQEKKDNEKRNEKPLLNQPHPHSVNYAGNFSGSSRDIRLDAYGEYMLHASCRRMDGSYQASSISLNKILENDRGSFRWASNDKRDPPPQQGCGIRQVTVQPGDTLRGIAKQVGSSFEEIARINSIQNPDLIYPGQILQVPGGGYHHHDGHANGEGGSAGNFGLSARNVNLVDGGRRVEAELMRDGQWVGSSIVLDERIGNDNGTLTFKC